MPQDAMFCGNYRFFTVYRSPRGTKPGAKNGAIVRFPDHDKNFFKGLFATKSNFFRRPVYWTKSSSFHFRPIGRCALYDNAYFQWKTNRQEELKADGFHNTKMEDLVI